jgi:hypothetical protein
VKKVSLVLLLLVLLALPNAAYGDTCTEPMDVTTPCSGVLLPPEAAAMALQCLEIEVPKYKLELRHLNKLFGRLLGWR